MIPVLVLKSLSLQSECGQEKRTVAGATTVATTVEVESLQNWSRKVLAVLQVVEGVVAGRW